MNGIILQQIDATTVNYKLVKDNKTLRNFKIKIGSQYIVEPINKNKKKHRGRRCIIQGFDYNVRNHPSKARVKFLDSGRIGKIELDDLMEI